MVIIVLKGTIPDCFQSSLCTANCLQHDSSGSGAIEFKSHAIHQGLITCNIGAMWYEETAQLLCLTELKSHLVELSFIS